ncbi:NAD(+)--rifampin ADP-ribosyltransferase [Flavihumibacter sp. UBA7668]|uniref:NAD(+)--rifampin ADP-ribosyltransferase n=1 Tax=Flavihumibacter sp. UBA7668 TaxID=1946542 RepID=UPI0025B942A5|nr:NAD(+)--rifampin ADP-ribosyltransferase [Flavihumibacter sp. UBA7668]
MNTKKFIDWDNGNPELEDNQFLHGTKAAFKPGDFIGNGYPSNYKDGHIANHVYFSKTLESAKWGAELAVGNGKGRIYIVAPTGTYEDDPNLTNKRFPGNPSKSYRSKFPVEVVGELKEWQGHTAEQLQQMKEGLAKLKEAGKDVLED